MSTTSHDEEEGHFITAPLRPPKRKGKAKKRIANRETRPRKQPQGDIGGIEGNDLEVGHGLRGVVHETATSLSIIFHIGH